MEPEAVDDLQRLAAAGDPAALRATSLARAAAAVTVARRSCPNGCADGLITVADGDPECPFQIEPR